MCLEPPATATSDGLTRISFRPNWMEVRSALERAHAAWRASGLGSEIRQTGEQVLAEVLNNVVEHAQADRPDGIVQIETARKGGGITCIVRDDGAAMPGLTMPEGKPAEIGADLDSLPEGGFGWFMIRYLTEDLSYSREDDWNHLRFRITGKTLPPDSADSGGATG